MPTPCDPAAQEARVATFWARAVRIRELEDELDPLRVERIADMIEMQEEMKMTHRQIAAVCQVSHQYVGKKLKPK
jgi:ribosomal protein L29